MTDTTERAELLALAGELADKLDQMPLGSPNTLLRRVESALRRAAQDQKPPPAAGWDKAAEIVRLIDDLRSGEGDSVTILCDNPDFNGQPNCAVICNAGWTDWQDRRFAADTVLDALSTAAAEKRLPSPRSVIAESNGHHWVQRFNLTCCRDCGIVRRADDSNSPCKGVVGISLRTTPAATKSADVGVGVPCGYALVPIKPTSEMIEAGCEHNPTEWNEGTDLGFAADVANDVYVAMVRSALSHQPAPVAANASTEARLREALERLLTAAKLLQQNAVGCAANHYGHDCELNGLPGWLTDTKRDIDAAETDLAFFPHASDCAKQGETTKSEGAESQREGQAQTGPVKAKTSPSALEAGDRPSDRTADVTEERHPIETLWREVGLPEYFLGKDGTNHKLYALYDAIRASDAFTVGRR